MNDDPLDPIVGHTYRSNDGFLRTVIEVKENGAIWWRCSFGSVGATDAPSWRRIHTPEPQQVEPGEMPT